MTNLHRTVAFAALAIAAPVAGFTEGAAPVDLATLPVALRSTLPAATAVKLPTGQNESLATLLDAHAQRLERMKAPVMPPQPPPASKRETIGNASVYLGGASIAIPSSTASLGATRGVRLDLAATNYGSGGWAAPYVAFCSAARASLCLYAPGPATYALNYPATGTMSDLDPFFSDADCAKGGGVEIDGYCTFVYPMTATIRFDPGTPPVAEREGACPAEFVGKVEGRGIATIAFDRSAYETDAGENAAFSRSEACVIRLYETPKRAKR